MYIIRSSVVHMQASDGFGYDVTHSVYCHGDRSPRRVDRYERLSYTEMVDLLLSLASTHRPGWEYEEGKFTQPPLWAGGD